jgi:glycosyltransferase involved in cell wall biosynthesis
MTRPILSICIPTYNRAFKLNELLSSLSVSPEIFNDKVELVISDNCSTDTTSSVIKNWANILRIRSIVQNENIGASANFYEVCSAASGKWILAVGDDDQVAVKNLLNFLDVLSKSKPDVWFIVNVLDSKREFMFPSVMSEGLLSNKLIIKSLVLFSLINPIGFLSSHVFPSRILQKYSKIDILENIPWPHVFLMLRWYLSGNDLYYYRKALVAQAPAGALLSWQPSEWSWATFRSFSIIYKLEESHTGKYLFLLVLRDMYSYRYLKERLFFRLLDPLNYRSTIYTSYASHLRHLKHRFIFLLPIIFIELIYIFLPKSIFSFRLKKHGSAVSGDYDGKERGY